MPSDTTSGEHTGEGHFTSESPKSACRPDDPGSPAATWSEIVARLERATGPDRELDALIAERVGFRRQLIRDSVIGNEWVWVSPEDTFVFGLPRFTKSLDAALKLVPEEYGRSLVEPSTGKRPYASLYSQRGAHIAMGAGATLAIATCIAAAKARMAPTTTPQVATAHSHSPADEAQPNTSPIALSKTKDGEAP